MEKVTVELIDDRDGGPADETIEFGIDGVDYEIDLSYQNASELRDRLALWVAHAGIDRGARGKATEPPPAPAEIRVWATFQGFDISGNGRIPNDIEEAFHRKHPNRRRR